MQARLSAVQQALIVVTVVAFAVAALVHPAPHNAEYHRALAELTSVDERFDRERVERLLLERAQSQGRQPLGSLAQAIDSLGPPLRVRDAGASIDPLVRLQLATLGDLAHFAQPGTSLPIAVPDLKAVGRGLAWRLKRDFPGNQPLTLRSAQLQRARVAAQDVAREAQVLELQQARDAASQALDGATKRLDDSERLYEARVKRHAPRQLRVDAYKARHEARQALRDAQRTLHDADLRYEASAEAALRTKPPLTTTALPARAVVRVEVERGDERKSYAIAAPLELRTATLPPLRGADLRATRAAGLWEHVKTLDISAARAWVRAQFNWHYRYIELLGLKLGGMTVLQLTPCVLPLLLGLLLARMRAVSLTYNPFRTRVRAALPRVGFRTRLLDALAVIVLPLMAAVFAITSLMTVGQIPALPLIAAVACLLLGAYAFVKLGELQRLIEDVVRSHSHPPPEQD